MDDQDVSLWDVLLDVVEDGTILSSSLIPTAPNGSPIAVCNFDVKGDRPEQGWCLPLLMDRGLLLHYSSEQGTYRRVGFFKVSDPNWFLSCPTTTVTIV
jgi:hypothetical protein